MSSFLGLSIAALFKTGSETPFFERSTKTLDNEGSPHFQPGQTEKVMPGNETFSLEDAEHFPLLMPASWGSLWTLSVSFISHLHYLVRG